MDTQQQYFLTSTPANYESPAQLWIGPTDISIDHAHTYMQQRWCSKGGCKLCTICKLITQHQYHSALWICPSGTYTKEDLEAVFDTLKYQLDEDREMIIVIQSESYKKLFKITRLFNGF